MKPKLYLFDLDGTLADSAPDLARAANYIREKKGLPPLPFEELRPSASGGARLLLKTAIGINPSDPGYKEIEKDFLDYYEKILGDHPKVFDGVYDLIHQIEAEGAQWGIVTNKAERFTTPLLIALNLKADSIVCGDTLDRRKPFPDQILHAMWELDRTADETIYVGDDIRDIQAAQAAGCTSAAAAWGYLGCGIPISDWGADYILDSPIELITKDVVNH